MRKLFAVILLVMGCAGLVISAILFFNHPKPVQYEGNATNVSVERAPTAVKPSSKTVSDYTVPATNPKYIAIPSIKVKNTPIIKLGLLRSGAIATPSSIFEAGWYDGSALPGQPGAMFIYGHVSNWQANGIFYDLKKLKPGNTVSVTRGDGTVYTYQVTDSKVYASDAVDMHAVLNPIQANKPGLNLMTCTGKVIKGTSEFDERLVVFAVQVNP